MMSWRLPSKIIQFWEPLILGHHPNNSLGKPLGFPSRTNYLRMPRDAHITVTTVAPIMTRRWPAQASVILDLKVLRNGFRGGSIARTMIIGETTGWPFCVYRGAGCGSQMIQGSPLALHVRFWNLDDGFHVVFHGIPIIALIPSLFRTAGCETDSFFSASHSHLWWVGTREKSSSADALCFPMQSIPWIHVHFVKFSRGPVYRPELGWAHSALASWKVGWSCHKIFAL